MKQTKKYNVNGNVENQNVNGKVTVYPNNINKVSKKAVIAGFRTSLKELKRKFGTISIYDKQKTVKAASLILAGTITLTSLTGCTFGKKEEIKDATTTETVMAVKEETQRITYTVEFGDSLWSIASKYCDTNSEIVKELTNDYDIEIIKLNNMSTIDGGVTNTNENYLTIMNSNIELLRKELYK